MRVSAFAIVGASLIVVCISAGFLKVDDVTWQQWRLVFSATEGLGIGCGIGCLVLAALNPS